MESELANNQEKEKKVGVAERQAAKMRLEYQDAEQIRIQFQDEVTTINTILWTHCKACSWYNRII